MPLPPDRGHIRTEQPHQATPLDQRDLAGMVNAIIEDQSHAAEAVYAARNRIEAFIDALVPRVAQGGRLFYVGAGTSGRLGVLDASECPPTFNANPDQVIGLIAGGDAALRTSSESLEDDPTDAQSILNQHHINEHDSVVGIAAGGSTPWVLGAIDEAHRIGAMTALLTCAKLPSHAVADHHILLDTGPELVTGSTRMKAGTATKITLNTITTCLFVRLGKVYQSRMIDLRATNQKLHDRCLRILHSFVPTLSRESANQILDAADGCLRTAIMMSHLDASADQARNVLEQSDWNLSEAMNFCDGHKAP